MYKHHFTTSIIFISFFWKVLAIQKETSTSKTKDCLKTKGKNKIKQQGVLFFTIVEKTNESHCCSNQQVFFVCWLSTPIFFSKNKKMLDHGGEEEVFVVFAGFWKIKTFKEKKQSGCKMRFICFLKVLAFQQNKQQKLVYKLRVKHSKQQCVSLFLSHTTETKNQ